jgi:hypothetical protein
MAFEHLMGQVACGKFKHSTNSSSRELILHVRWIEVSPQVDGLSQPETGYQQTAETIAPCKLVFTSTYSCLKLILHIALSDEVLVVSSVEVVVLHQSVEFVESSVVPVVTHQSVESVDVDPVPPPPSARTKRVAPVASLR